jgi:hypothetical protein
MEIEGQLWFCLQTHGVPSQVAWLLFTEHMNQIYMCQIDSGNKKRTPLDIILWDDISEIPKCLLAGGNLLVIICMLIVAHLGLLFILH